MQRRYAVWDVFTTEALSGNPLAVVLDGDGLSDQKMQAIAREFNLSETVFVLPAQVPVHTARIRIFTPASELPFAGHPTVGAAIQLAQDRISGAAADLDALVVLEENIGNIRVAVTGREGNAPFAEFDVPKLPERAGIPAHDDRIASALGLTPNEIGFANYKCSQFDAGSPFAFVPVRDLDVIGKATVVSQYWDEAFSTVGGKAFLYCRETTHHHATFHARMFAPTIGIAEDPATGSAVAAFAAVVQQFDQLPEGMSTFIIEQGIEMGRPSEIKLEIEIEHRVIKRVRIGGSARLIMRGTLML